MKVYLDTVGCRLNQAEIEHMAHHFRKAGHTIVAEAGGADLVVINTCAVTSQAAADSRQKIRHAARVGAQDIIATGCWASIAPERALVLPKVRRVIPNDRKDSLVAEVLDLPPAIFDQEPLARRPLPGLRQRTRAFIKVQDGCDNRCTFCLTTVARGAGRSYPVSQVIADVRSALDGGVQEVVLTGVHLGSWGQDFGLHLRDLIEALLSETEVPRLRLSSLEPWDLDVDFFSLWADGRLCPHLHLPLQSGSASTLRRMARKTTPESFRSLVAAARASVPQVAITTDVITGFPGETEGEFAETVDFVRSMDFAGGHVFTYSPRPGTAAAHMPNQVVHEIRRERNAILHTVFDESAAVYRAQFVGRTLPVLWEASAERNAQGWCMEGLTGNYVRVTAVAPEPRWNSIDDVRLIKLTADGMRGNITW
jgi:threonylcarbamoyladenosine tRNA methylthiotransferase MtaB